MPMELLPEQSASSVCLLTLILKLRRICDLHVFWRGHPLTILIDNALAVMCLWSQLLDSLKVS